MPPREFVPFKLESKAIELLKEAQRANLFLEKELIRAKNAQLDVSEQWENMLLARRQIEGLLREYGQG